MCPLALIEYDRMGVGNKENIKLTHRASEGLCKQADSMTWNNYMLEKEIEANVLGLELFSKVSLPL